MIYLLEDKTSRRNDYGWNDSKVTSLSNVLVLIDNATKLEEYYSEILNDNDSVVLFHESFFENEKDKVKFLCFIDTHKTKIAYFSGSKNQRTFDENSCSLPASVLYLYLDVFINYYKKAIVDFSYLLFGENRYIEELLIQKITKVNNENINPEAVDSPNNILVFTTSEYVISKPISNAIYRNDCDYACEDKDLAILVDEQKDNIFDAIYIPLCMGETLSDYIGLRLAMFFRLSNTLNKYAHIFIYGVANYPHFIKNECAEVLKWPGVEYISADSQSIKNTLESIQRINEDDYNLGLRSIHLNIPSNIGDNHSVTNKWGIYRWSQALDDSDESIEKNLQVVSSSLYFRYLAALYPAKSMPSIDKEKLTIKNNKQSLLNVLYVDDEADDGWYELLHHLLYDINHVNFDYVGSTMKNKTQNGIISLVMEKIKSTGANVVILDLRLCQSDFTTSSIEEITGFKLLNKIKILNRGIQVLMFSATNKIWNYLALQKKEVDGFVLKEAPLNSIDPDYTETCITELIKVLNICSEKVFRKDLWARMKVLKKIIDYHQKRDNITKEYANNIITLLAMAEDNLFASNHNYWLDSSFVNLFRIVELTAYEWIVEKVDSFGNIEASFKEDGEPLKLFSSKSIYPKGDLKPIKNLSYKLKIANLLYKVGVYDNKIAELVDKRNNFTHPKGNVTFFSIEDVKNIFGIVEKIIVNINDD